MADEVYTVQQVATLLGVSDERVRQRARDGSLPAFAEDPTKKRTVWLFPTDAIDRIVDAQRRGTRPVAPPRPSSPPAGGWDPSPAELAIAQGRIAELEATLAALNAAHAREVATLEARVAELERERDRAAAALRAQLDAFLS